jgi:hypothetical protein
MCKAENRHSWRIVAATGLEADEAVLDDIDTANAVGEAEFVEGGEQLNRVGVCLLGRDELGRNTVMSVGSLGALRGDWVIVHMSSGGD